MRVSVLVFAILGGVFGMMLGLVAMAFGGIGNAVDDGAGNQLVGLGVSAIAAAIVGLVCGVLHFAGKARTLMSWLLTGAAVWHLVSISYFAIPGTIFLGLAALFAWWSRKGPAVPMVAVQMQPAGVQGFAMTGGSYCRNCGQPGETTGKFCGKCGQMV